MWGKGEALSSKLKIQTPKSPTLEHKTRNPKPHVLLLHVRGSPGFKKPVHNCHVSVIPRSLLTFSAGPFIVWGFRVFTAGASRE